MSDSRTSIRKIVAAALSLLRPLAQGNPAKLDQLLLVHLLSMQREMSAFKKKDEAALDELRVQIAKLAPSEKSLLTKAARVN